MDIEQLTGAVYSRKDVIHHNGGVIDKLREEISVALGSNSKYIKHYSMNSL
jgi:hypothetical protein